jgi:hypothetical protein
LIASIALPFAGAAETGEIPLSPKVITANVARMLIRILDISLLHLILRARKAELLLPHPSAISGHNVAPLTEGGVEREDSE